MASQKKPEIMPPGTRKQTILRVAAIARLAAAILLALSLLVDTVAAQDLRSGQLAAEFTMLALEPMPRGADGKVTKWTVPIRFGIHGGHVDGVMSGLVMQHMAELRRLTGNDIQPMDLSHPSSENFSISFLIASERNDLVQHGTEDTIGTEKIRHWNDSRVRCIHIVDSSDGIVTSAEIYIKVEIIDPYLLRCIHEELSRALGIFNVADIRDSIFGWRTYDFMMTTKDELFLRILYSPELHPNTPLAEARREVELIASRLMQ
jgi:hypothetical protein